MPYPAGFKFTKDHEWIESTGDRARVGITDYAQKELGDVVFVELPQVGTQLEMGDELGSIESVKAVSELFSPLSGEVIAANAELGAHPEQVNSKPHEAWMIRLRPSSPGESASLLDASAYEQLVK